MIAEYACVSAIGYGIEKQRVAKVFLYVATFII